MDAVHVALLPATAPFALGASLRAMAEFMPGAADQVVAGERVRKALVRPGRPDEAVVVEVGPHPLGEAGINLRVFAADPLSTIESRAVEQAVSRWLSLDDDVRPFLARARRDLAMAPILAVAAGLHQVRFASLGEGAAYFALAQRSAQRQATARKRLIAQDLGPRLTVEGVEHVAFPALATLTALGPADLVRYAGSSQRAQRLGDILAGVAGLDEEWLRAAPYEQARAALLAVPGIGAFTANAVLLRVLGRPDDVPLEMAQFRSAAESVYGAAPPSPTELREWYAPYVGWWSYYTRTGLGWLGRDAAAHRRPTGTAPAGTGSAAA